MTTHRYYIVHEDGDVYWTDNDEHAKIFNEVGTSIVIDTKLNLTMIDGETQEIEDIIPEDDEGDEDNKPDDEADDDEAAR